LSRIESRIFFDIFYNKWNLAIIWLWLLLKL
jgi:hypothetical protein